MGLPSPSQPGRVVTTEGLPVSAGCPPPLQDGLTPHPHCVQGTFTITFMELLADKRSGFGPVVLKSSNQYDMFVQIHSELPGLTVIHLTLKELLFVQSSRSQHYSSRLSQTKHCPPLHPPTPPQYCAQWYIQSAAAVPARGKRAHRAALDPKLLHSVSPFLCHNCTWSIENFSDILKYKA